MIEYYYVGDYVEIIEAGVNRYRKAIGTLDSITVIGDKSKGEGIFRLNNEGEISATYTHRFEGVFIGENDQRPYVRVEKGEEDNDD